MKGNLHNWHSSTHVKTHLDIQTSPCIYITTDQDYFCDFNSILSINFSGFLKSHQLNGRMLSIKSALNEF